MANLRRPIDPARLEQAAAKLLPIERDVLVLNAREGLAYAEIAEGLGIDVDAVERHLASALCTIARELDRMEQPRRRFWRRCTGL